MGRRKREVSEPVASSWIRSVLEHNKFKILFALGSVFFFKFLQRVLAARKTSAKKLFGKTVLITGGMYGLSRELAKLCLKSGVGKLIIATLNVQIAKREIEMIKMEILTDLKKEEEELTEGKKFGVKITSKGSERRIFRIKKSKRRLNRELSESRRDPRLKFVYLDASDLQTVVQFKKKLLGYDHIDIMFNTIDLNDSKDYMTKNKIDFLFGVNYLVYFYLTMTLMDRLKASKESVIVNIGSHEAKSACKSDFYRAYEGTGTIKKFLKIRYRRAKMALSLFSKELHIKLRKEKIDNIKVVCYDPGTFKNRLKMYYRDASFLKRNINYPFFNFFATKDKDAAMSLVSNCLGDKVESGESYCKNRKVALSLVDDQKFREWFFKTSDTMVRKIVNIKK